jgi:hypothetical protein
MRTREQIKADIEGRRKELVTLPPDQRVKVERTIRHLKGELQLSELMAVAE